MGRGKGGGGHNSFTFFFRWSLGESVIAKERKSVCDREGMRERERERENERMDESV